MKSWPDRLREMDAEQLEKMIERQKKTIEIKERDLKTMRRVLAERSS